MDELEETELSEISEHKIYRRVTEPGRNKNRKVYLRDPGPVRFHTEESLSDQEGINVKVEE